MATVSLLCLFLTAAVAAAPDVLPVHGDDFTDQNQQPAEGGTPPLSVKMVPATETFHYHPPPTALKLLDIVSPIVADYIWGGQGNSFGAGLPEGAPKRVVTWGEGTSPTTLPSVFHAKTIASANGVSENLHVYYDYGRHRLMLIWVPITSVTTVSLLPEGAALRPANERGFMKKVFEAFDRSRRDPKGVVDRLNGEEASFPGIALWMLFTPYNLITFSRSQPFCDKRKTLEDEIPPPDVMKDAKYLGQMKINGLQCNVFAKGRAPGQDDEKPLVTLYENAKTGEPIKLVFFSGEEINVTRFEPNGKLSEKDWKLPHYCYQAESDGNVDIPTPERPISVLQ